jgi:hypothetical protein
MYCLPPSVGSVRSSAASAAGLSIRPLPGRSNPLATPTPTSSRRDTARVDTDDDDEEECCWDARALAALDAREGARRRWLSGRWRQGRWRTVGWRRRRLRLRLAGADTPLVVGEEEEMFVFVQTAWFGSSIVVKVAIPFRARNVCVCVFHATRGWVFSELGARGLMNVVASRGLEKQKPNQEFGGEKASDFSARKQRLYIIHSSARHHTLAAGFVRSPRQFFVRAFTLT